MASAENRVLHELTVYNNWRGRLGPCEEKAKTNPSFQEEIDECLELIRKETLNLLSDTDLLVLNFKYFIFYHFINFKIDNSLAFASTITSTLLPYKLGKLLI